MLNRLLTVLIIVPVAVILVALAVANRALVPFTLDPFNPGNPALTIQMPFFVYMFLALILGLLIGGLATWFKQSRYRKLARQRGHEVETLKVIAERREELPPLSPTPATGSAVARTGL